MLPELNALKKRGKASVISILPEFSNIDLQAWPPIFLAKLE